MKVNFSTAKVFVPTWNGNDKTDPKDQLTAEFTMPDIFDVFDITDVLANSGVKNADESKAVDFTRARRVAEKAGQYLPKYVALKGAENFTIKDVVSYSAFFALATELLFALVEFARPDETDVKNS